MLRRPTDGQDHMLDDGSGKQVDKGNIPVSQVPHPTISDGTIHIEGVRRISDQMSMVLMSNWILDGKEACENTFLDPKMDRSLPAIDLL